MVIVAAILIVVLAAVAMYMYMSSKKTTTGSAGAGKTATSGGGSSSSGGSALSKVGDAVGKALGMSGGGSSGGGGGGGGSSAKGPFATLIDNLFGLKKNSTTTQDSSSPTGYDSEYADGSYTQGDTYYDKDGNPLGHVDANGDIYGENGSYLGNMDANSDGVPDGGQIADEYYQQQQEEDLALTDPYQVSDPNSPYYDPSSAYYDDTLDSNVTGQGGDQYAQQDYTTKT